MKKGRVVRSIFQIYNTLSSGFKDNDSLTEKLFECFGSKQCRKDFGDSYLFNKIYDETKKDPIFLVQLIGLVHQKKKESSKIANTDERKHLGIFYTDYNIAKTLISETLQPISDKKSLLDKTFFEPCSGIGIFALAYIDYILKFFPDIAQNDLQKVVNSIYCSDVDSEAIELSQRLIPLYIKSKYGLVVTIDPKNFYSGNILFLKKNGKIEKNTPGKVFNRSTFDIIVTNPPYKLLKANANKYASENVLETKELVDFIKNNRIYKLNEGTLNYYKIFIEEIIENYSHTNSYIGLLIPNTLLSDLQSTRLRKKIFTEYTLSNIFMIPEKNDFFPDITQAFCFFGIDKSCAGRNINVIISAQNQKDLTNKPISIDISELENIADSMPIVVEERTGWKILKKLNQHKKVKNFPDLLNMRGELDLTFDKSFVTTSKTSYPLIRGNIIKEFSLGQPTEYVGDDFLKKINGKRSHTETDRISCQQISNINGVKRLKFTSVPRNYILANSCNYICKTQTLFPEENLTLKYLLGLFNSLLMDWRFRLTNSNNHISNYEISELPIPIPSSTQKKAVEELVDRISTNKNSNDIAKLNKMVFEIFSLEPDEVGYIINKYKNNNIEEFSSEELLSAI